MSRTYIHAVMKNGNKKYGKKITNQSQNARKPLNQAKNKATKERIIKFKKLNILNRHVCTVLRILTRQVGKKKKKDKIKRVRV